jgi:parvulin-like peptidyl-prolyl isomerase
VLKKILREPLVHFVALALAIFIVYGALNREAAIEPDRIVVSHATIEQIAALFAKTWQRPPSPAELKGLVDDHVKEEIYYREARALGLEANDTLIRRRLRQKMEFLNDAAIDLPAPADAELEQYLQANAPKFAVDAKIAFEQVYLSTQKRGAKAAEDAGSILAALRADPSMDRAQLGDTTLLPPQVAPTTQTFISEMFGVEFAKAVAGIAPGAWSGPITSTFGLHVVRVTEVIAGRSPPLSEVREAVVSEWTIERRRALTADRYAELLKRYQVTIETEPKNAAQALAAP